MNGSNLTGSILIIGTLALAGRILAAADEKSPAPSTGQTSSIVPTDDLTAQVDYYIRRLSETLAKKDEFDDAAKTRVKKDASTLSALAHMLSLNGNDSSSKPAALISASQKLAKTDDYESAQAAFEDVKQSAAQHYQNDAGGRGKPNAEPKEKSIASLRLLMQQVPVVNSALRRGLNADAERFKKLQDQLAGQSATLAAIAQTIWPDTSVSNKPADVQHWHQFSDEMRDAAAGVNQAIHAGDQPAATVAMTRLAKSCESCHAAFRKDDK
jgi:hypothetical protein